MSIPSPRELGLPSKYVEWREQQIRAIEYVRQSSQRIRGLSAAPGVGKTAIALALGVMQRRDHPHARTLILAETKSLQAIYAGEGHQMRRGMVANIMGVGNYRCHALEPGGKYEHLSRGGVMCDRAPCAFGMSCKLRDRGCTYYGSDGKLQQARDATIVINNYANWISAADSADREEKFGEFDQIICDEGHAAMDALCRALVVEFDLRDVEHHQQPLRSGAVHADWVAWCRRLCSKLQHELDEMQANVKSLRGTGASVDRQLLDDLRRMQRLVRSVARVSTSKGEWVTERSGHRIAFKPVWGDEYTESHLLRDIPNVVFMSGTLVQQDLRYMGIGEGEHDWLEMASPFPVARRPVYVLPCARMRWDMSAAEEQDALSGVDTIIKSRAGWRYLIHTVSYDRAEMVARRSKFADTMLVDRRNLKTDDLIREFKDRSDESDLGLVGPAMSTGHDFPDDLARFQIIMKIPIADRRDVVTAARVAASPKYLYYAAMKYITQAALRIVRSEEDFGETWITDASWVVWFEKAAREFMAAWFRPAVKVVSGIGRRPKL